MKNRTLELVVLSLAEGVTEEEFLSTVGAVSEWLKAQPGFISRELSRTVDRRKWIEVVWWESLEDAMAAVEAAETSEAFAPMFEKLDLDSMQMLHATHLISARAPDVR